MDKQLLLFKLCRYCGDTLPSDDNSGVSICISCLIGFLRESLKNFDCQNPFNYVPKAKKTDNSPKGVTYDINF